MTVSGNLHKFAIELGARPSKLFTIPNGADKDTYHLRDTAVVRRKYGIPAGVRAIVCAGELIEAKGHHLVVQAVSELNREGANIQLIIAGGIARGGRPFEKELRQMISERALNPYVRLLGWLPPDELSELMSAADVFCLASYTEGWPNVVNEALACGTPVVASDVGAVREMILGPEFGYVVPARNQSAVTHALKTALSQPWNRTAIAAWGQSRSWDQVAQEVFEVLQRVVGEAHVRN